MRQHIAFVSIILFFVLMGIAGGTYATERYESTGSSRLKQKSLPNALVAEHFKCNRDGLWANLDTMEVGNTVSDRSRRPTYRTTVKFECSPDYQKDLPVEE
jgi:hypothetical protein